MLFSNLKNRRSFPPAYWARLTNRQRLQAGFMAVAACLTLILVVFGCALIPSACVDMDALGEMFDSTVTLDDPEMRLFNHPLVVGATNFTQLSFNMAYEAEWRQYPHLVVYGVLATDKPENRALRDMQRSTWLKYPDVATRKNAFNALMLVLYAVAPLGPISPNITVDMMKEMDEHHDVLMLRMKEELPIDDARNELPLRFQNAARDGYHGFRYHVSHTRKLLMYLLYAHNAFPTVPFFAKGDEGSYVYVPEYMVMVRQLPRINIIYGAGLSPVVSVDDFSVLHGKSYLITRDVLRDTVTEKEVYSMISGPFTNEKDSSSNKGPERYSKIGFHHADWTVGATIKRMFGSNPYVVRRLPPPPPTDPQIPPVEGWGKHYMDYVFNPSKMPHGGSVVSSDDDRYCVTYTFPSPREVRPGNVLWVDDVCRVSSQQAPNPTEMSPIIITDLTLAEHFTAHWDYYALLGGSSGAAGSGGIMRPMHVDVVDNSDEYYYFSTARLWGMRDCALV